MQSTHIVDQLISRAQMQMVGVGKLDLAVDLAQLYRVNTALDGGTGANVHEHGGLNIPVYGVQNAATRASVLLKYFKLL
jgi:hypothetical protein